MRQCAYCQSGNRCAACIAAEWRKKDAQSTFESLRDIERSYYEEKRRKAKSDFTHGLLVVLATIVFVVCAYDSTKKAWEYEQRKPAILKAHGVQ